MFAPTDRVRVLTLPTLAGVLLALGLAGAAAVPAGAQEILPHPAPPFEGKIGRTVA